MKKILMFAPFFFDYEKRIKEGLEKAGYTVTLYNDYSTYKEKFNFSDRFKIKILRQKKKLLNMKKKEYFDSIYEKEKNNSYDIFFVIKGSSIPECIYEKFKKNNLSSQWISYQWDDMENCREFLQRIHFFDKIYTYSYKDSIKYNFTHRPFFFCNELDTEKKTDLCFIGTAHSDRGEVLKRVLKGINEYKLNLETYLIIDKNKYLRKFLWIKKNSDIYKFKNMSYEKVMDKFAEAKVILEIQYPTQDSITTRSIEALGLKSKVITTTEDIKNQDFYTPENYLIIDRKNPVIPLEWIKQEYKEINKQVLNKYTLSNWIDEIFKKM